MSFLERIKKIFGNRKTQEESSINKDENQKLYDIYHEDKETQIQVEIAKLFEKIKAVFTAISPDEQDTSEYMKALTRIKLEVDKRGINYEPNTDLILANLINKLQTIYNSEKKVPVDYDKIKKELEGLLEIEVAFCDEENIWSHFGNFNYNDITDKTKLKAIVAKKLDECYEILGDECLENNSGELDIIRYEFDRLFGNLSKIIRDYSESISEMLVRNDYKVTDEKLKECYEFLTIQPQIQKIQTNFYGIGHYIGQYIKGKRLEKYSKDDVFMKKLQTIMRHDTEQHKYLFHGTCVLEDSSSILKKGLLMMREDLDSTTVEEFTQEELLLYERRRNAGKYWNRICCNN